MPELMFQYRAASFFGRLYAPDILNGMQSVEEVKDVMGTIDTEYEDVSKYEKLLELFEQKKLLVSESDVQFIEKVIEDKDKSNYDKVIYQLNKLK
jgi:rRNA processing protein Gar1